MPDIKIKIHTEQTTRDFWKEFVDLDTVFLFQRNGLLYLVKAHWEPQTHGPTGFSSCRNPGSWKSPGKNHTDGQTKLQSARTTILTVMCFLSYALDTLPLCWELLTFQVNKYFYSITIVLFTPDLHTLGWAGANCWCFFIPVKIKCTYA